ncbi:MAG: deoxynucleoside kinase [Bacteroidetes bacterium]|nr:deoxynucleoside kinase [Bacteroidota bacterium]
MFQEQEKSIIKHIAIAGNIGAGKTTLCTKLAKNFSWDVHYESTDNNPYLSDFYDDMKRWSFNLQIYFLNSRYQQILKILNGDHTVIQDRTIYEDAFIFAPNLHDMGLMSSRDFENYFQLFKTMSSQIKAPDLLIYLRASIPTLVDHIQARGREYEGSMSLDYLKRLNDRYEDWISQYAEGKLLIINADDVDFQNNPEDLGAVVNMVQGELHGLF